MKRVTPGWRESGNPGPKVEPHLPQGEAPGDEALVREARSPASLPEHLVGRRASHPLPRTCDGKNEATPHTQVALFPASGRTVLLEAPVQSQPNTCACAQPSRAATLTPSHAPLCSFNGSFAWLWASGHLPLIPPPTETSRSELRAHFPPTFWMKCLVIKVRRHSIVSVDMVTRKKSQKTRQTPVALVIVWHGLERPM